MATVGDFVGGKSGILLILHHKTQYETLQNMINRVLIRIKVVQMLYSYLLTRSEFKIETAPETSSQDRRYAYQAYVDMLMVLLRLSGCSSLNRQPTERHRLQRHPARRHQDRPGRWLKTRRCATS